MKRFSRRRSRPLLKRSASVPAFQMAAREEHCPEAEFALGLGIVELIRRPKNQGRRIGLVGIATTECRTSLLPRAEVGAVDRSQFAKRRNYWPRTLKARFPGNMTRGRDGRSAACGSTSESASPILPPRRHRTLACAIRFLSGMYRSTSSGILLRSARMIRAPS